MLELWHEIKKRKLNINKQERALSKKDSGEMITSMFKMMVCGISNEITKVIEKYNANLQSKNQSRIELFKKLKDDIFNEKEYRLSLWLTLTFKEKLEMLVH
jgi:hypothetical protein